MIPWLLTFLVPLLSLAAMLWYLRTFQQMHRELQVIRRYLAAIHAHLERK